MPTSDEYLAALRQTAPVAPKTAASPQKEDPYLKAIQETDPYLQVLRETGAGAPKNPLQKAWASIGTGFSGVSHTMAGILRNFGRDPSIPKTREELEAKKAEWMQMRSKFTKQEDKDIAVKVIGEMERTFQQYQVSDEKFDESMKNIDAFLDQNTHFKDPRYQPKGFIESIAYGVISFLPEAPLYSFVGGPAGKFVEGALESVAKKFGPEVAAKVAESLPELYAKARKYALDTGVKMATAGTEGAVTELAAGKSPEEAAMTGLQFAGATGVFHTFLGALGGFLKTATKKLEFKKKEPTFEQPEDGFDASPRPDIPASMKDPSTMQERTNEEIRKSKDLARQLDIQALEEKRKRWGEMADKTEFTTWMRKDMEMQDELVRLAGEGTEERGKNIGFEELLDQEAKRKAEGLKPEDLGEQEIPSSLDGSGEARDPNPHMPQTEEVEQLPFFEELFRSSEKFPIAKDFFTVTRRLSEKTLDWFRNIPNLTRLGLADESFYLASARAVAPKVTDDLVARVMGTEVVDGVPLYKNERAKHLVMQFLNRLRQVSQVQADQKFITDSNKRLAEIEKELKVMDETAKWAVQPDKESFTRTRTKIEPVEPGSESFVRSGGRIEPIKRGADLRSVDRLHEQLANRDKLIAEQKKLKESVTIFERRVQEALDAHDHALFEDRIAQAFRKDAIEIWGSQADPLEILTPKEIMERSRAEGKEISYKEAVELSNQAKLKDSWRERTSPMIDAMTNEKRDPLAIEGDIRAARKLAEENLVDPIHKTLYPSQPLFKVPNLREILRRYQDIVNPHWDSMYRTAHNIPESVDIGSHGQYAEYAAPDVYKYNPETNRKELTHRAETFKLAVRLVGKHTEVSGATKKEYGKKEGRRPFEEEDYGQPRGTAGTTKSGFAQGAKGTSEYTTWMEKNFMSVLQESGVSAAKETFYRKAQQNGAMAFTSGDMPDKELPQGVSWVKLQEGPVERQRHNPQTGKIEKVYDHAWVRSDAYKEVRTLLDLDQNQKPFFLLQFATTVQLKQLADFVVHGKNLITEVARSQGKPYGKVQELLDKIPILGHADAYKLMRDAWKAIETDSPRIRSEMRELAELGVLRGEHGADDIVATAHYLWKMDTGARLLLSRFYKELVKRNLVEYSKTGHRDFVLQVGMYNDRLMNHFKQKVRRFGLSPFLVAGENFNKQAWRTLYTNYAGAEGKDEQATSDMKAVNMAGTMIVATIPMMLNYATTGTLLGREGTPLLAWDLGNPKREDGTFDVLHFGQLSGHARATRLLGLEAFYQGVRGGQTPEQTAGHMKTQAWQSLTHPYLGPGASSLEALHDKEGWRAALSKLNPVFSFLDIKKPGRRELETLEKTGGKKTADVYAARYLDSLMRSPSGALGAKSVRAPLSAMAEYVIENRTKGSAMTDESVQNIKLHEFADQVYQESETKYPGSGDDAMRQYIMDQIQKGVLKSKTFAEKIWRERKLNHLQRGFKQLDPEKAIKAYELATPEEKAQTFTILWKKIEDRKGKHLDYPLWYEYANRKREEIMMLMDQGIINKSDVYMTTGVH
jgi:hypothetical protein